MDFRTEKVRFSSWKNLVVKRRPVCRAWNRVGRSFFRIFRYLDGDRGCAFSFRRYHSYWTKGIGGTLGHGCISGRRGIHCGIGGSNAYSAHGGYENG